jgi:hypothetical protein
VQFAPGQIALLASGVRVAEGGANLSLPTSCAMHMRQVKQCLCAGLAFCTQQMLVLITDCKHETALSKGKVKSISTVSRAPLKKQTEAALLSQLRERESLVSVIRPHSCNPQILNHIPPVDTASLGSHISDHSAVRNLLLCHQSDFLPLSVTKHITKHKCDRFNRSNRIEHLIT